MACDPLALAQAASCLQACVNAGMGDAIKIYLLAQIAGVDPDPAALIQAAGCIASCIPAGAMPAVQANLLCQIAEAGGAASCPVEGTPDNDLLFSQLGLDGSQGFNSLSGITEVTVNLASALEAYYDFQQCTQLVALNLPNMVTFGAGTLGACYFYIASCPNFTTLSAPLMTIIHSFNVFNTSLLLDDLASLVTLSFPSLVSIIGSVEVINNPALVNVSFPVWLPEPGANVYFYSNALSAASVNHILARCVASPTWGDLGEEVDVSFGTNAAPSGQGLVDKATLIGRGASVVTN